MKNTGRGLTAELLEKHLQEKRQRVAEREAKKKERAEKRKARMKKIYNRRWRRNRKKRDCEETAWLLKVIPQQPWYKRMILKEKLNKTLNRKNISEQTKQMIRQRLETILKDEAESN